MHGNTYNKGVVQKLLRGHWIEWSQPEQRLIRGMVGDLFFQFSLVNIEYRSCLYAKIHACTLNCPGLLDRLNKYTYDNDIYYICILLRFVPSLPPKPPVEPPKPPVEPPKPPVEPPKPPVEPPTTGLTVSDLDPMTNIT